MSGGAPCCLASTGSVWWGGPLGPRRAPLGGRVGRLLGSLRRGLPLGLGRGRGGVGRGLRGARGLGGLRGLRRLGGVGAGLGGSGLALGLGGPARARPPGGAAGPAGLGRGPGPAGAPGAPAGGGRLLGRRRRGLLLGAAEATGLGLVTALGLEQLALPLGQRLLVGRAGRDRGSALLAGGLGR